MWDRRTDMWCVTLILIAVASCNAEVFGIKSVELRASSPSRIIGGDPTTVERYPFIVQVIFNGLLYCGGLLVTTRHVLSAAHCVINTNNGYPYSPEQYAIRMGASLLNTGGSLHQVSTIIVHSGFNTPFRNNDIALVVLSSPATLSSTVQLASIAARGQVVPDNSSVTAIGWGVTHPYGSTASTVLNEVTVRKINHTICEARYHALQEQQNFPYPITDGMICAGLLDVGGKDVCRGDSGGPLIYDSVVVGVTSWSGGCAHPVYPSVYTRVAYHADWIQDKIAQYNAGTVSRVGAVTLLVPMLFLIISVQILQCGDA